MVVRAHSGNLANLVFYKLLLLNSRNSMNHGKVQKWYGYQACCVSSNRYIPSVSVCSEVVKKMASVKLFLGMYLLLDR